MEVHYPTGLCDFISETLLLALRKRGFEPPVSTPINLAARSLAHSQPATNKIALLISEFKTRCVALFFQQQCMWPSRFAFLQDAKVLQKSEMGCESLQALLTSVQEQCLAWNIDARVDVGAKALEFPCVICLKLFGFFWTEDEFVEQAIHAKHPLALDAAVPPQLLDALAFNVNNEEATVARARAKFISMWTQRAIQLEDQEKALKESMDCNVASAVECKRILLFEEMLQATNFPDMGVVDELRAGSDLTGDIPPTGMLPGKFEPALISEEECANAARVRKAAVNEVRSSGDDFIDNVVWQKTLEEVSRG